MIRISIKIFLVVMLFAEFLSAQSVRKLNNDGVDLYEQKKYADAEVNFRKVLEKNADDFISNFNLGDSYYKQQKYDEAIKSYQDALGKTNDDLSKAKVYHNIGNSLLKANKIEESIEAYKNA
ncbi:MAG: tetratricopeptide repeat protein, partial [Ignavibacterium sp.]|uniref:tetratricopeptide repeat protein n=1 Tax=Ignavibacterium sp. TaxID=2651167 RepID=UPI004049BC07